MNKRILALILCFFLQYGTAFAGQVNNPWTGKPDIIPTITEEDGVPSIQTCRTIKFSDGTVTDNGDSTCSVSSGGGGGGSGDVESVGDCLSGACYDGSSDGGTYMRLYDGDSNYGAFVTANLSGDRTYTFPNYDGTMATLAGTETLTNKSISGGQITSAVATATALAANGANCSAGQFPLGVDASGASESCTAAVSTLDSLTDVAVPTPTSGDHLVWNGSAWIPSASTSVVGSASSFYLDTTASLADNFTLSITPSTYAETANSKTVLIATSPVLFERFVSGPLGRTSIPAGTWTFDTYAAADSNTGTQEVKFRVNKRRIITGMTGTFTGAGPTRTFTVSGGTPFVAGDANASRMLASLIETPTQTAWISGFTSSSVVTVTLTDAAFVNVSGVELSAIYYYLFDSSTLVDRDMVGVSPDLYTTTLTEPAFTGFIDTDRLVVAYFGSSDNDAGTDTMRLYYGGAVNFSHFDTPISTLHNDLAGLNVGDYRHLTAAEYTGSGTGVFARVSSPVFTTPNIGSATGSITGNAGTATALAANGANCSAGSYPLGVDASGATESCTVEQSRTGGICFHFGNATDVITTGEKKSARREVKKGGTITGWTILSLDDTSGSIGLDVWKDTYANYPPTVADTITASAKPSVTTATKNTSTTLTSWTTSFSAGDVLSVNVDSVTSFKDVELCLDVTFN